MEKNKIEITKNKNGTIRASIMITLEDEDFPIEYFDFTLAEFFQHSEEQDELVAVNKYHLITEDIIYPLNSFNLELIAKIARYLDWENIEIDGYEIVDKRRENTNADK